MCENFTATQIADMLEESPMRIRYIISKLRIRPVHRVGIIRLFSEQQVQTIKDGLYTMRVRCS